MGNGLVILNIVFLLPHLELQHFSKLSSGFRVGHLHLTKLFSKRDPSSLFDIILAFFDTQGRKLFILKMLRIFLLLGLERLLLNIASVNLVLSNTCPFHSVEVSDLLYRVIVRLQLVCTSVALGNFIFDNLQNWG
jgi:hypothetical protein